MTGLLNRAEIDAGISEDLVCRAVIPITHDVTSFVLASSTGRSFAFDAGQYVTVAAAVDGQYIERCYTISSASTCTDTLTITVKRVPGGPMSNWLHDRLTPGDRLSVTGPLGRFSTVEHPASKHLFLSAGSGITPLMSMTRTLLGGAGVDIVFVHNARTPRDIVFRAELDAIAAAQSGIRITSVCEDDAPDERWAGPCGRLSAQLLHAAAPDLLEREVFTCGPLQYREAVRELLRAAGADPARCHEESYSLAGVTVPSTGTGPATGFAVDFRRSGRVVSCEPDDTVLQAGLRAGITLPSSCGEGMCGTCKHTLLAGAVDMQHNGGIRPREIAQGSVLLCCSTPLADLVVDA